MLHELKIKKSFADAIVSGDKTFEIRNNDRGFQKGDLIKFKVIPDEIDSEPIINHFLEKPTYIITYILSGWGLQDGYVVLGIKQATLNEEEQI